MTALLALRLGGLGDLLAVLPSLRLLRRAFPGRRLILRGRPEYGSLLRDRGVVDEVISADAAGPVGRAFEERIGWFQKASSVPADAGRYFVFDPASGLPVSRYFFDRTAAFVGEKAFPGGCAFDDFIRLPGAASELRTGPAVIHPGSGSARKCWPLERFLELAGDLARSGLAGRFVAGEAEPEIAARLRGAPLPSGWDVLVSPPLSGLAALLETAPVYVGNDSGVTHLAAACGAPVVALFRTEFAVSWRPFGRTIVLAADEVMEIPLEAATGAVAAALAAGRLVLS